MNDSGSLSHTKWECKYYVVFTPKCRSKALYYELRQHLGELFRELASHKEYRIEEGHLMPDHVPMLSSIPLKCSVPPVMRYLKGKSAINMTRTCQGRRKNFTGQSFRQEDIMFRRPDEMRR
jgi:putative transposase